MTIWADAFNTYPVLPLVSSIFVIPSTLYLITCWVPLLAVTVRRLHDTNRPGPYLLLGSIPILGFLVLYWLSQDSDPEENEWGPSPKMVAGLES